MVKIDVSVGELFDKITILQIKKSKITDKNKLCNINKELAILEQISYTIDSRDIQYLINELKNVNTKLWTVEDELRIKESCKLFDASFIELARSVYVLNDKRANLKRQINISTNSQLLEEKSYESY